MNEVRPQRKNIPDLVYSFEIAKTQVNVLEKRPHKEILSFKRILRYSYAEIMPPTRGSFQIVGRVGPTLAL